MSSKKDLISTKYTLDPKTKIMDAEHGIALLQEETMSLLTKILGLGEFVYAQEFTATTIYQDETFRHIGTHGMKNHLLALVSETKNGNYSVVFLGDFGIHGIVYQSKSEPCFDESDEQNTKVFHDGKSLSQSYSIYDTLSSDENISDMFMKFYDFQGMLVGKKTVAYKEHLQSLKRYYASLSARAEKRKSSLFLQIQDLHAAISSSKLEEEKTELFLQLGRIKKTKTELETFTANATQILCFIESMLQDINESNSGERNG